MNSRNIFLVAGIPLLAHKTTAQIKPDIFINKIIIELHHAGLINKLIISKYLNAKFDV